MAKKLDLKFVHFLDLIKFFFKAPKKNIYNEVDKEGVSCPYHMTTYSVRSGFDLLLKSYPMPKDSEILFTAINIQDMFDIAGLHGYRVRGVDVDPGSGQSSYDDIKASLNEKVKILVITHLYGGWSQMTEIIEYAQERGVVVVEDMAQGFQSKASLNLGKGDVVFFSFGTIKTATALGGGIVVLKNKNLYKKMLELQSIYPVHSKGKYLFKALKYGLLHFLSKPWLYGKLVHGMHLLGVDHEVLIHRLTRSRSGQFDIEKHRLQPNVMLESFLNDRVNYYDFSHFDSLKKKVGLLINIVGSHHFVGVNCERHTYWLLPIKCDSREGLIVYLREHGFDSTTGRSFACAGNPEERVVAESIVQSCVYLPCYDSMPITEFERLAMLIKAYLK